MLQLSEVYDFLRNGESQLKLNKKKLAELRKNLNMGSVEYGVAGEEFVMFTTAERLRVKIFEDGLIVIGSENVSEDTLFADVEQLKDYYEQKLSPAINYIFSLGAPVPKELAHIENIYPYFVVCDNATREDIAELLSKTERQKYFEFDNKSYSVLRGDKYYFINNKRTSQPKIERYVEEQIFIREFKGQLHRYLNLHRIIWEKIDQVKDRAKVRGSDVVKFSTKLESYAKTITLIDGRIRQMSTYISTRERIAKQDKELEEFLAISGFRYETLRNTLEYIKDLWDMTKNYVQSAQKLFDGIKQDVTSSSINSLTIVTSMSAGAAILDLFTESEPSFTTFGFVYFFILAIVGWAATKILSRVAERRKYEISDVDIDTNIK
jgi:hypothetical protein